MKSVVDIIFYDLESSIGTIVRQDRPSVSYYGRNYIHAPIVEVVFGECNDHIYREVQNQANLYPIKGLE